MTKQSQTIIPDKELNEAIFRFVKIQTEPHTMRVKIKKRRRPSGRISIFASFLKTFMKGNNGVKLRRKENIVPEKENISAVSTIGDLFF